MYVVKWQRPGRDAFYSNFLHSGDGAKERATEHALNLANDFSARGPIKVTVVELAEIPF